MDWQAQIEAAAQLIKNKTTTDMQLTQNYAN